MRRLSLLLLLLMPAAAAPAQETSAPAQQDPATAAQESGLSLDEIVRTALEQNPGVLAARSAVEEAQARVKQARSAYYPQFQFSGLAKAGLSGTMNGVNPLGLANSPFFDNYATGLSAFHPGVDFGRTRHSVNIVQFRRDALEGDLRAVEDFVVLEANQAYYNLLRARELEQVAQRAVASRELNVRQAEAFYEGELRSKLELDLAQVVLGEARLDLIEARNRIRSAQAELGRVMGASQSGDYALQPPDRALPQPGDLGALVQEAYQNRPELTALERRLDAAHEALRLARSQRKPWLSFFTTGGWARTTPLIISRLAAVGLGLAFPVMTFGRLEGLREEAEQHISFLEGQLEDLRQRVSLETRNSYFRLQNALESLPVRELQVGHAREAVRLAEARYREQLGTIVELNEAETQLAATEAENVTELYTAKMAEAELHFAVGRP